MNRNIIIDCIGVETRWSVRELTDRRPADNIIGEGRYTATNPGIELVNNAVRPCPGEGYTGMKELALQRLVT